MLRRRLRGNVARPYWGISAGSRLVTRKASMIVHGIVDLLSYEAMRGMLAGSVGSSVTYVEGCSVANTRITQAGLRTFLAAKNARP